MLQAFTETLFVPPIVYSHSQYTIHILSTYHPRYRNNHNPKFDTHTTSISISSPPTENCTMVPRHLRFSSVRRKFDCTQFRRHGTKFSRIRGPRVIRKLQLCRERYVNSRPRQSLFTQSRHAPLPINLPPIELISILDTHPVTRPCYACRNHRLAEKASSTDVDRTVVN